MSVRFNITMSNDLNNAIDEAAAETDTTKTEIMRKALTMYLAVRRGPSREISWALQMPRPNNLRQSSLGCKYR